MRIVIGNNLRGMFGFLHLLIYLWVVQLLTYEKMNSKHHYPTIYCLSPIRVVLCTERSRHKTDCYKTLSGPATGRLQQDGAANNFIAMFCSVSAGKKRRGSWRSLLVVQCSGLGSKCRLVIITGQHLSQCHPGAITSLYIIPETDCGSVALPCPLVDRAGPEGPA